MPMKFETYRKCTDLTVSRFIKIEEAVTKLTAGDIPLSNVHLRQLNTYFTEIRKKRDDFELNVARILELDEATESVISKDIDKVNDLYVSISSLIEAALNVDPVTPSSISAPSQVLTASSPACNVRLPKLSLQSFDGNSLKWVSYINLYDATVHKNASISNVAKFQYLLSTLSGEPLNLIKSFALTAPNYVTAYNLLRERYHNSRRLSTLHLNHLLDLPALPASNAKQLRSFLNTFHEHTESLKALECDVTSANPLLAAHLLRKLDQRLIQKLEQFRLTNSDDTETHSLPSVLEIIKFLNLECSHMEDASLHSSAESKVNSSRPSASFKPQRVALVTTQPNATSGPKSHDTQPCFGCSKIGHKIYTCPVFKNKTPSDRYNFAKDKKRCISCLGPHSTKECRSKNDCSTCHKKHHSLLHFSSTTSGNSNTETPSANEATYTCLANKRPSTRHSTVLLGTTLVQLIAANGTSHVFRALLDSGSMTDFISEKAAQLLGTPRSPSNISVSGLAQMPAHTKGSLALAVKSISGHSVATNHSFHILERIALNLPRVDLSSELHAKVKSFILADPTFHKPGPIDVLLGASLYPSILTNECHSLGPQMPYAIGTLFGYVIVGTAPCTSPSPRVSHLSISLLSTTDDNLHASLQRFWTQEELPPCDTKTEEEKQCDEFFHKTHTRDSQGRYSVRLPFRTDSSNLGLSKSFAEQRFHSLEHKLQLTNNFEFCTLYTDFMQEYSALGHMTKCDDINFNSPHYYLPHHGILKAQSSTTKLRVVFDASSKTTSGLSLNDLLLTGPKLQNNICDLLIQFRLKNIVFSCDIRQMYRQINVHPEDQSYQLILWRNTPTASVSTYKLTTVTYGMNCSPYLAIKTLRQLADDEGENFPRAAEVLKNQSYVDDLITGASTEEEAIELQNQLIGLLKLGGFELRKWVSNSPKLLQNLPVTHQEAPVFLQSSSEPHFSILGIHWSPVTDCFKYKFNFTCTTPTKRKVLSIIAQIYDPCGFLSPCIMTAKCLMQLLWISGTSWDDPLSPDFTSKWHHFVSDLESIKHISIPRSLHITSIVQCDLHGFADASESGYAAVVYLRCTTHAEVCVSLLIAKTRAAPLKKVTLPRLELCAAHLLAHLTHYCVSQLSPSVTIGSVQLWTDSTVTLSWLQTPPYRLKTYVANRVAQTQELFSSHCWRHVPSTDNPADCASRGILPSQLVNHPLWWHGPPWLQQAPANWPSTDVNFSGNIPSDELKATPISVLIATSQSHWELLSQYSSWTKLLRVMAYVLRFVSHSRRKKHLSGPLSCAELLAARLQVFKIVQGETFAEDLRSLSKDGTCSSKLQRLNPFIDQDGLIRVGGRLHYATLSEDARHPYLLPKKHPAVDLLIDYIHTHHLHAGTQLTQALLCRDVWILSARSVVRSRIFQCMQCFRQKPRNTFPLMGDLPKSRITPARPFLATGIDYGGPFTIKIHNLRSIRHIKAYLCLFVCFVTKAVHLEVATDLSTDSFIAALTRFVSRRGLCNDIYSDCATNFVGAKNALQQIIQSSGKQQIQNFALENHINFHFNPPAAPHQGGLWESAIKSAKHHLKRVLGTHIPTLIQFNTLACQVEAMLNSRPLTALSSDPNDFQALTPGHFLIGAPLTSVPEHYVADTPDNRLAQWQLYCALKQRIWKRWSKEYLHTLQQRLKWAKPTRNLQVGDLVLIHQDTPSLTWPLARITKTTLGHDNIVRVVELKTSQGTFTRPAVKVFLLPFLAS